MRLSRYPINTSKETPADAEVISHKLMLRAGLIRRLAAGVYTFLPMGLRAVRKVEKIIREEMDRAGAYELLMPAVQPAELWQESGRWEEYGPELLRFTDRGERAFVIGPTHEEVITDLVRREIISGEEAYEDFTPFPPVDRDLAVLVPDAEPSAGVLATVQQAGGELLTGVSVFDVYSGEGVPEGEKSLALRLRFRAPDRTLSDEEIEPLWSGIIAAIESAGGKLRG
mgnify:CR=1 FL=1